MSHALFVDIARLIPSEFLDEDFLYLSTRMAHEGEKFSLMALPGLGKAIEKALIREEPLKVPLGWNLRKETRLPLFLNHLFKRVFREDGMPINDGTQDPTACLLLRQLCLLYSKVERPVEEAARKAAMEQFTERVISCSVSIPDTDVIKHAQRLLHHFFAADMPEITALKDFEKNPWGRHGPGAVADKSSAGEKWDFTTWPGLSKKLFLLNGRDERDFPSLPHQPPARCVDVPKDFRGPRIICIEPKENQFAQQGLMVLLYRLMHKHKLTKRSINFWDTAQSQELCYRHDVCTIDLKDASDYLSIGLARKLLPRWVFRLITRYRTRQIHVNGAVIVPQCLATMGSALCFPLQTLIYWALAQSTITVGWKYNRRLIRTPVRVFGDDIIVPSWAGPNLIGTLSGVGLHVNQDKTCLRTLVKESCGEWVYSDISQILIKVRATNVTNHVAWLQYLSYRAQAKKLGLISLAAAMGDLAREVYDVSSFKRRYNRKLQRLEILVPVFASTGIKRELVGQSGLYAWFVHNDTAPFLHGTRKSVKRRWLDYGEFVSSL